MQTQVMFYILSETSADKTQNTENVDVDSAFYHTCLQASHFYRQGLRVFIYTPDKQIAEQIDEQLWAFDSDSFVPHNLVGEGPKNGSPVEISSQAIRGRRPVLINLTSAVPNFANQFQFVVDFVPTDNVLKQQARERYKQYRQQGFQVQSTTTEPITN